MSHQEFAALVEIIAAPWSSNNFQKYNLQFSKLKTNQEKVAALLLSIFFQIPKISIKASNFFSEKCHISLSNIPDSLPQTIFDALFRLLSSLAVRKNATYSRVIVTLASSLPLSAIRSFLEILLKYPTIHQLKAIYSIIIQRDNTLFDYFFQNYNKFEKGLSTCLFLQQFSQEFILKITSLFLSGKVSTSNNLFYSFCYYINHHLFQIQVESTDIFILSLFQQIEQFYFPRSHSILFNLISQSLDEFPLPFMTIHMFYHNFDSKQLKSIFASLINSQSSIQSYFVISQVINSPKLKEIYSISICAKFIIYQPTKKTINFFKKSFERITHLKFELRVLTKVLEITSKAPFTKLSLDFLTILEKFTPTASVLKMILIIFLSKEQKSISNLVNQNLISLFTAFYLLGNSPLVTSQIAKKKYVLLIRTVIPLIDLKKIELNCSTTKTISNLISQKDLTVDMIIKFLTKFAVNQIKPQQFNRNNAIELIRLFKLDDLELGYQIEEVECFTTDNTIQSTETALSQTMIDKNEIITAKIEKKEVQLENDPIEQKELIVIEQKETTVKLTAETTKVPKKDEIKNETIVHKEEVKIKHDTTLEIRNPNSSGIRKNEKPPPSPKSVLNESDIDDIMLSADGFDIALPDESDLSKSSNSYSAVVDDDHDYVLCDEETLRLFDNLLISSDDD